MGDSRILTHLSFPVAVSAPSPRNIQWSEDGQLFILSRNAIHILTPEFSADLALFSAHTNPRPLKSSEFPKDVEWIMNRIEIDKTLQYNWAIDTDDWCTLSLGSLDLSWIGMAPSPTNASRTHCCVMATLTSNLEVSLWSPLKNHINGEWQKIQDVTQTIKDSIAPTGSQAQRVRTMQVQCIAWSSGISTGYAYCRSILALGNRAGSIICMEYARETGLSYWEDIQIANDWIIDMIWSPWSPQENGSQCASIFCSVADGSVYKMQIELSVHSQNLKIHFNGTVEHLHPIDFTPTTSLSLIQSRTHDLVLIYIKPGVINIRKSDQHSASERGDSVAVAFPIQSVLRTQDPFAAIAGITYRKNENYIQIHASDGTVYQISDVTGSPKISIEDKFLDLRDRIEMLRLSKEDFDMVTPDERIYISAVIGSDHTGILGWFYECRRPNDFSYKLDSQHTSFFGLALLPEFEKALHEHILSFFLAVNDTFLCGSAAFKFQETLICLKRSLLTDGDTDSIMTLLQENTVQTLLDTQSSTLPKNPQKTLFSELFEDSRIFVIRSRLTLMNSLLSSTSSRPIALEYLNQLTRLINESYLQIVMRHCQSVMSHQDDDKNFMLRWLTLCHTSGDHLQREAMATAAAVGMQNEISSQNAKICETCPACHAIIPVDFESEVVCENKHRWQRCSVTSFILATPNVRTCVGCRRKSLLPRSLKLPSDMEDQPWLPSASRGEFVNNLLETVVWCIYCENRFVRLL